MRSLKVSVSAVVLCAVATQTGVAFSKKPLPRACDLLENKTYIFFKEGKFDDLEHAGFGGKLTFVGSAGGQGRFIYSLYAPNEDPTNCTTKPDGTATCYAGAQQIVNFACFSTSDTTGYLGFTSTGGDAGNMMFTVYNHGAMLWTVNLYPGREVPGWLLQLPPPPVK